MGRRQIDHRDFGVFSITEVLEDSSGCSFFDFLFSEEAFNNDFFITEVEMELLTDYLIERRNKKNA